MPQTKFYFIYILANRMRGTLYTGITNDLIRRVAEHRQELYHSFSSRYGTFKLVWYEAHNDIEEAIAREKRIKRWRRQWKFGLIEENNPDWHDLYPGLTA